jgi:hypothetical protein
MNHHPSLDQEATHTAPAQEAPCSTASSATERPSETLSAEIYFPPYMGGLPRITIGLEDHAHGARLTLEAPRILCPSLWQGPHQASVIQRVLAVLHQAFPGLEQDLAQSESKYYEALAPSTQKHCPCVDSCPCRGCGGVSR